MKQYIELLRAIKENGCYKPAARENMPGTKSLFGYQFRHNLQNGFPLLTTKKIFWKGVVIELLWFLKGDINIKYLVDNGVHIWDQDAYQYYLKKREKSKTELSEFPLSFEDFIKIIKEDNKDWNKSYCQIENYKLGDCGFQYGKVWRSWNGFKIDLPLAILKVNKDNISQRELEEIRNQFNNNKGRVVVVNNNFDYQPIDQSFIKVDQIKNVINSLKNNPESRRHIVTAIDPAHDNDLALYWCHAMFQFNCREIPFEERLNIYDPNKLYHNEVDSNFLDGLKIPKYYLDCQLYQRSADVFLGVPFNIASYALLTHIIAKICNMIPGEFIHTFGDVHIYDNHKEAVEEQLKRIPTELPKLDLLDAQNIGGSMWQYVCRTLDFSLLEPSTILIENYNPQSTIKAELKTGLK